MALSLTAFRTMPYNIELFGRTIPLGYTALGLLVVFKLKTMVETYRRRSKMPPGPRGIPVLGNALQVPVSMPWFRFTELSKEYGPIFSLNMAGQDVVVLTSHKVVADLFDRRSTVYSDRPRLVMAAEILTGGIFMVFESYGKVWQKMRRASHEEFSPSGIKKYQPQQNTEAATNILDLLREPENWVDLMKRTTGTNILAAVYGWPRLDSSHNSVITRIHAHTARIAGAVVPGAFLVELFPWMKHLPTWMAKWKREGLEWHRRETEMFEGFNSDVEDKIAKGDTTHSFVRAMLENQERHGLDKKESAWLAGLMFSAGAETTFGSMLYFTMAMILYPDVQRRAQEELDRVVGRNRVPRFEDKDQLPYIRALVKETLRWRPVGPLAVPRRAMEDDVYEGYLIPKGTTVIPNVWGMNRDPEVFPDFDDFRPERFLDETGTKDTAPPDTHGMGHVTFGFGRRICAGYNFANQVLFIQFAMMLWALKFEAPVDEETKKTVLPDKNAFIDAGVVVLPAPFKCKISARGDDVKAVIEREVGDV